MASTSKVWALSTRVHMSKLLRPFTEQTYMIRSLRNSEFWCSSSVSDTTLGFTGILNLSLWKEKLRKLLYTYINFKYGEETHAFWMKETKVNSEWKRNLLHKIHALAHKFCPTRFTKTWQIWTLIHHSFFQQLQRFKIFNIISTRARAHSHTHTHTPLESSYASLQHT